MSKRKADIRYVTEKESWGDGPWKDEPDHLEWTDEATGLACQINRNHIGCLCGYVAVPTGHPFFGLKYHDEASQPIAHFCGQPYCRPSPEHVLDVHGGVTFAAPIDGIWWIGFDAGHSYDVMPTYPHLGGVGSAPAYRDVTYMKEECARLAEQLVEVAA